jgi:hypothetical protein
MTADIFDDPEMLEEMARISEEISVRMKKEKISENEILQEMKDQAFDNIRQIIEEEIQKNKKIKFSKKYQYITQIDEVYDTADYINQNNLAMCDGERKIA